MAVPFQPSRQPDKAQCTGNDEGDAPSEGADQPAKTDGADGRADQATAMEYSGGQTTFIERHPFTNDPGASGVGSRFAHTHDEPATE
ncbi:hypothetical protein D3C80_1675340 [compost metagenome]